MIIWKRSKYIYIYPEVMILYLVWRNCSYCPLANSGQRIHFIPIRRGRFCQEPVYLITSQYIRLTYANVLAPAKKYLVAIYKCAVHKCLLTRYVLLTSINIKLLHESTRRFSYRNRDETQTGAVRTIGRKQDSYFSVLIYFVYSGWFQRCDTNR